MTLGWIDSSRTTSGAASLQVSVETCCGSNRNNGNEEEQDDGIVSSGWLAAGTAARKMWVKW
jgi:hypothetical protein